MRVTSSCLKIFLITKEMKVMKEQTLRGWPRVQGILLLTQCIAIQTNSISNSATPMPALRRMRQGRKKKKPKNSLKGFRELISINLNQSSILIRKMSKREIPIMNL